MDLKIKSSDKITHRENLLNMLKKIIKETIANIWKKVTSANELLDIVDNYISQGDHARDRGHYDQAIINYEISCILVEKYWQGLYQNALLIKEDPADYKKFKNDVDYVIKNYTRTSYRGYALAYNKLAQIYQLKGDILKAHEYLEKAHDSLVFITSKEMAQAIKSEITDFYKMVREIDQEPYENKVDELQYKMILFEHYCFTKKEKKAKDLLEKIETIYKIITQEGSQKNKIILKNNLIQTAQEKYQKYFAG